MPDPGCRNQLTRAAGIPPFGAAPRLQRLCQVSHLLLRRPARIPKVTEERCTGPRPLVTLGMLLGAASAGLLTRLGMHSSYAADILPSVVLIGAGLGFIFAPVADTGTSGVAPQDTGVASATVTGNQLGGSIGTSLLNSLFASAVAAYIAGNFVHGSVKRSADPWPHPDGFGTWLTGSFSHPRTVEVRAWTALSESTTHSENNSTCRWINPCRRAERVPRPSHSDALHNRAKVIAARRRASKGPGHCRII